MMFNYPYMRSPYYNNYYNNYNKHLNTPSNNYNKSHINNNQNNSLQPSKEINNKNSNYNNFNNNKDNIKKSDSECIDILGIKLHLDDILLMLLIYSLYSDGIQDNYLFFVLILLLLT